MRRTVMVAAMIVVASQALAGSPFYELTEAQKRKIVVPDIKALTYCVARQAESDTDAVGFYRSGNFGDYIGRQLGKCPREMNALLELYESTYGDGEAEKFIRGPYLSDLPRAVLSVIRPQLDAKVADLMADEQRVRDAEAAQEAEAQKQAFIKRMQDQVEADDAQRKVEEDRAATVRAETERKAAEARAATEKRERVDTAMRSMAVLRDKLYDCADQQLPGLVKSGESADVLASAAMTICGKTLSDLQDAALEVSKAREEIGSNIGEAVMREQVKALVKERVVADAVQAKAGVGAFATTSK